MLEGIADLVSKETVKGIRDIRDESSKEGIRVVIEIKQNADPHAVLNQLYRSSRLQESYSANMIRSAYSLFNQEKNLTSVTHNQTINSGHTADPSSILSFIKNNI